ncbi:MAG: TerC family protein [Bacteroidetes bacterium]|nr:TerC family protein [Bacteroidota bacterium]
MLVWSGFLLLVLFLLALDLGVFNRNPHVISTKEAMGWTTLWVSISLLFSVFVYFGYENNWLGLGVELGEPLSGKQAFIEYLTGYLIEQSLSIDNIFVIAMIFTYFRIPQQYQHRVLFWGIVGALVFRGIMIFAGVLLIKQFSWINYVFGAILLYSAWRMAKGTDETDLDPAKNKLVIAFKRFFPVVARFEGERFFIRRMGVLAATPLFIALLVVETTDIMFAFDSIPAIFAITTDPFIVFTSNIFAILGLRSLYFVLASILDKFKYIQYSLVAILAFVGVKMILHHIHWPEWISLVVIISFLLFGVFYSIWRDKKDTDSKKETP